MVFLIYMNKFTFHYFHCQVLEILNFYWALLFIHAHETDLSWAPNTKALCRKAFSRLWIIRRLKRLNVSQANLLDVYEKQIRCICEYACPVWTGALTRQEVVQIERVQKAAFAIILGNQYKNYKQALKLLGTPSLENRREILNLKFARKCKNSEKFNHWFTDMPKPTSTMTTRSMKRSGVAPVQFRTKAFSKSTNCLPYWSIDQSLILHS